MRFYFLILFSLSTYCLIGQTNDFGVWTTISLQKKISKKIRVSLDEEMRLYDNATRINCYLTDVSINYKPIKKFTLGLGYRITNNLDDPDLQLYYQHRFYFQGAFKYKFNEFNFSFRSQLQSTYTSMYSSDNGLIPKFINRNKITITYSIYNTKFSPYISAERFYQFNYLGENGFNKNRFSLGIDYQINTRQQISGNFMFEQRFNTYKPANSYIVGISYNYTL